MRGLAGSLEKAYKGTKIILVIILVHFCSLIIHELILIYIYVKIKDDDNDNNNERGRRFILDIVVGKEGSTVRQGRVLWLE